MLAGPGSVLRAIAFARLAGVDAIAAWMCWAGWRLRVGCDRCVDEGERAACWGRAGCHGFACGCGCVDCAEREARAA